VGLVAGLTPLIAKVLRPSDAELVQTLMTSADTGGRHKAAVDLAARHSLQATQDLAAAVTTNAMAKEGLAALRDEYIARFAVGVEWETLEEREEALKEMAQCLGVIGDATSIDALGNISCSYGQQRTSVRVSAVRALAQTKTTTALPHLIQAVVLSSSADPGGEIGDAASAGLLLIPGAPGALIQARAESAGNPSACSAIEETLAGIGEPAVQPLVAELLTMDWTDEVLAEIGTPVIPAVTEELTSKEPIVRYRALGVLLRLYQQDKSTLAPYLVVPGLVPLLIEARSQAHYGDERDAAVEAVLAGIGKPAVEPLVALLSGTDWADEVLVGIGTAAVPAVSGELKSKDATVCYRALGVLLRLYARDKEALTPVLVQSDMVPLLIEARTKAEYVDDRDASIAAVLTRIGEPAAKPLVALLTSSAWAGAALVGMGEAAVSALMSALKSQDPDVKFAAADVLVQMQRSNPESVVSLMSALEKEDLKFIATNYAFYIRLGQTGTEDALIVALNKYGNANMCLDYLNCGNDKLDAGATCSRCTPHRGPRPDLSGERGCRRERPLTLAWLLGNPTPGT
jgi:HEAT repeat protein